MRTMIITTLLAGLLLPRVHAAPAPPKPTLASALATAKAPETGTALAVAAETDALPDGATLPAPGASVADCAGAFGLTTHSSGTVTAIAPPTMTLLNDQPGDPDPAADVNPYLAFQELAGSLDDGQWQALTGERGLGLADLSDDAQRALFWAQFPGKTLRIAPQTPDGQTPAPEAATDVSPDLPQVRLRLGQSATLYAPTRGGDFIFSSRASDLGGTTPPWVVVKDKQPPRVQQYGVPVRAEVPNALKSGGLPYDGAALRVSVPLSGVYTVGDLVARIGEKTGMELYADPHYAKKALTVIGAQSASAADVLRALAVCVTGTVRRVGPASVLTDDLPGVAVTEQTWEDFRAQVIALRDKPADEARRALAGRRSVFALSGFGDPLMPTDKQERPDPDSAMGHFLPQVPRIDDHFAFSDLTPGQQAAARRIVAFETADRAAEIAKDPSQAPDLNGRWIVSPRYTVQALLPGVSAPVTLRRLPLEMLAWPPDDVIRPLLKTMEAWDKAQTKNKPSAPAPSLAAMLRRTPRRAILADPHTPAEVRALVAAMRTLGLNQLWLPVFQNGVARVAGTPLPMPPGDTDDLLDAALGAAKGTGITVFPVLSVLTWGPAPPGAVSDVNVLGQTSAGREAQNRSLDPPLDDDGAPPPGAAVSPFAPDVETELMALVKTVAGRPGIGGLVWRDTAPDGYAVAPDDWRDPGDEMGYTLTARLAFLRRFHADPWDVALNNAPALDFHLPNWDNADTDAQERTDWREFRADTDRALLRRLYGAARPAAPVLLVEGQQNAGWFGSWDDPRRPPPTEGTDSPDGMGEDGAQAKSQAQLAWARVDVGKDDDADDIALRMSSRLPGQDWDGFVLDLAASDGGPGAAWLGQFTAASGGRPKRP